MAHLRARAFLFAPLLVAAGAIGAGCDEDAGPGGAPASASGDAGIDVTPSEAGTDATSGDGSTDPVDAVDPTSLRWERLADPPLDGERVSVQADVAVDLDDRVLVAFADSAPGFTAPHGLTVYRQEATGWAALGGAPVVPPGASFVATAKLAVAKDGAIYVAYSSDGANVKRFSAGVWSTLPSPGLDAVQAFALDSAGLPVLAGRGGPGEANVVTRFDGTTWSAPSTPLVDAGAGLTRGVLDVAPRADTVAVIASEGARGEVFELRGSSSWTSLGRVGDELATMFIHATLAASPDGRLAVAWNNDYPVVGGRRAFAARFDEASRSFGVLDGSLGGDDPSFPAIAMDRFHRPYVAWRESRIRVAVYTSGWVALPDIGERGTTPALTLDRRDLPVVVWGSQRDGGGGPVIGVARATPR